MAKSDAVLSGELEQILGNLENAITHSIVAIRENSREVIMEDSCCAAPGRNVCLCHGAGYQLLRYSVWLS